MINLDFFMGQRRKEKSGKVFHQLRKDIVGPLPAKGKLTGGGNGFLHVRRFILGYWSNEAPKACPNCVKV